MEVWQWPAALKHLGATMAEEECSGYVDIYSKPLPCREENGLKCGRIWLMDKESWFCRWVSVVGQPPAIGTAMTDQHVVHISRHSVFGNGQQKIQQTSQQADEG